MEGDTSSSGAFELHFGQFVVEREVVGSNPTLSARQKYLD
jgi:hypothetical protein